MLVIALGRARESRSGAVPNTVAGIVCVLLVDVLTSNVESTEELVTSVGKVKLIHAPTGTRPGILMLIL